MINSYLVADASKNVSQSVTINPRLEYSSILLNNIMDALQDLLTELRLKNYQDVPEHDENTLLAIDTERTIAFSLETLFQIKKRLDSVYKINSIPELLLLTIPMIRTVSAELFTVLPSCSQQLSELSVQLGSIVLDSGMITEVKFDFKQSNAKASMMLDEVKLMVESKLRTHHPNLDFLKP